MRDGEPSTVTEALKAMDDEAVRVYEVVVLCEELGDMVGSREIVSDADTVTVAVVERLAVALSVPLPLIVTVRDRVLLVEREVDALAVAVVVSLADTVRVTVAVADVLRLVDIDNVADAVRPQCSIGAAPTTAFAAR